jgi:anti-sigma factor RsiW
MVDFLSDYIDGELETAVRAEFEKHMGHCAPCRRFLDSTRRTVDLYARLEYGEIPDELKERLKTFLEARLPNPEP